MMSRAGEGMSFKLYEIGILALTIIEGWNQIGPVWIRCAGGNKTSWHPRLKSL